MNNKIYCLGLNECLILRLSGIFFQARVLRCYATLTNIVSHKVIIIIT